MLRGSDVTTVRVLCVESGSGTAALVARYLAESASTRFDFRRAASTSEGLLQAAEADVVLLDMPVLEHKNLSTIRQLDEAASHPAIVVLLGTADEVAMLEALRLGAQDVILTSEIDAQQLRRRIRFATIRKHEDRLLRMLKTEAETLNRSRAAFLANVNHEIRTPLNAIMGFSEVIRDECLGPVGIPAYRTYAHDIHNAGTFLLSVVNDLLDLSRVDAGQMSMRESEVDLSVVVGAACHLLESRARSGGVHVSVDLPEDLPRMRGDRDRLQQIAVNLLSNAVKFTPRGGRVSVAARLSAMGELAIHFSDTGIGMAADTLERIWQPFGRADDAYSRNRDGVGLGLPLTDHLVRMHGGRIEVESAPGTGSSFTVSFPRDRLVYERRSPAALRVNGLARRRRAV